MEPFVWDDAYDVGIHRMDDDHRKIIAMINSLIRPESPPDVDSEHIADLLDRMTEYSIAHFRREEQLLEEHGYPGLPSQREQHREYRKRVAHLCTETIAKETTVPSELLVFLIHWWKDHILQEDMPYGAFLRAKGVT